MKIALVVPSIDRIRGNRLALRCAAELARSEGVELWVHTLSSDLQPAVETLAAPAKLTVLRTRRRAPVRMGRLFTSQLSGSMDRQIAEEMELRNRADGFDVVLVMSNEGHGIATRVRRWRSPRRPLTALCVYDPLDHSFLLRRDRPGGSLRAASAALYPALHWVEARRLAGFDLLFSVSTWTAELLDYLYGMRSFGSLAMVDDDRFRPVEARTLDLPDRFIALPTASLDRVGERVAARLAASGVPLVSFGPHRIPPIPGEGFVSDPELVEILSRASGLFFPFDYEALGLIPLESLACGTPVATFPKGGPYRELAGNPYVHFSDAPESIREACTRWLAEERDGRTREEVRRSVSKYSPKGVVSSLLESLRRHLPVR